MDRHDLICIMAAIIYATPDGQGDTCLDTADSVKRAKSIAEEVEHQEQQEEFGGSHGREVTTV
jgi:hypothetical protein